MPKRNTNTRLANALHNSILTAASENHADATAKLTPAPAVRVELTSVHSAITQSAQTEFEAPHVVQEIQPSEQNPPLQGTVAPSTTLPPVPDNDTPTGMYFRLPKSLGVKIGDEVYAHNRARGLSQRTGLTKDQVVRTALDEYFARKEKQKAIGGS